MIDVTETCGLINSYEKTCLNCGLEQSLNKVHVGILFEE